MDVRPFRRRDDLLIRCARLAVADVFADIAGKQINLLLNDADRAPERLLRHAADVLSVDQHGAAGHVVETRKQRTERGLAAARRTDESDGFPRRDVDVDVRKHFGLVAVAEGDVVVNDMPFDMGKRLRIRRIGDFGPGLNHLHEPLEAGITALELLREVDQHFDRIQENADVERVDRKRHRLESAHGDEIAARHQHERVKQPLEEAVPGVKAAHDLITVGLGIEKTAVAVVELLAFDLLVCERLHDTDAGERILHAGVDRRDLAAVVHENPVHTPILAEAENDHDQRDRQQQQRHRDVHEHEDREGSDDFQRGNHDVLGPVVRELGDVEQVADELRHHFTGVVAVVIGEREPLVVIEEVLPHIALHARAHDMPPARDEVLTAVADDIHGQQPGSDIPERGENRLRRLQEQILGQQIQDLRKREVDRADRQRADHVEVKQPAVRAIVADELPECLHECHRHKILVARLFHNIPPPGRKRKPGHRGFLPEIAVISIFFAAGVCLFRIPVYFSCSMIDCLFDIT